MGGAQLPNQSTRIEQGWSHGRTIDDPVDIGPSPPLAVGDRQIEHPRVGPPSLGQPSPSSKPLLPSNGLEMAGFRLSARGSAWGINRVDLAGRDPRPGIPFTTIVVPGDRD